MHLKKNKDSVQVFVQCAISSIMASTFLGILEAVFLNIKFSAYFDIFAFRHAIIIYGAFGLVSSFGISLLLILINRYYKKLSGYFVYWYSFAFYAGFFFFMILFQHTEELGKDYFNVLYEHQRYFIISSGILSALIFGKIFRSIDIKSNKNFSSRQFKYIYSGIILILIIASFIAKPNPAHFFKKEPGNVRTNSQSPNILIIICDALRADYLKIYGGDIGVPAMMSLREDAVLFTRAFSQSSWTRPSFASLLSGLYPTQHNCRTWTSNFPGNVATVQSLLKDKGYYTAAFFNNPNLYPVFNLHPGFDLYYCNPFISPYCPEGLSKDLALQRRVDNYAILLPWIGYRPWQYYRSSEEIVSITAGWIENNQYSPFFGIVHFMEPHQPYFNHPYDGELIGPDNNWDAPKEEILSWKPNYILEAIHMDSSLSTLIQCLKDNSLYDSMLIVFTADHGEEFYDHQYMDHGFSLYNEVIRVPFLIKLPNYTFAGETVDKNVSLIDVPVTLARILNLKPPEYWNGKDLFLERDLEEPIISDLFIRENEMFSIIRGKYKLIKNISTVDDRSLYELYDIAEDFDEQYNIAPEHPSLVGSLDSILTYALLDTVPDLENTTVKVNKTNEERLKALGYIE
ncbi:MAG: sulfatase-like hydrolase/transferase [candidate division Zixibacteria bacterium]|nr:sulfatase-like hydrolase/transferase [candidate division Zixibacteria bacterium]